MWQERVALVHVAGGAQGDKEPPGRDLCFEGEEALGLPTSNGAKCQSSSLTRIA